MTLALGAVPGPKRVIGQVVNSQDGGYLATLYGNFEGDARYSLVLAESVDGFQWQIRTTIAGHNKPGHPASEADHARIFEVA